LLAMVCFHMKWTRWKSLLNRSDHKFMPRREEFHADGDIYHPFSLAVVVVRSTDQVVVELYRYCR